MQSPLVNLQKAMERSTIFHGKFHYFYGHFSIAMLAYQRIASTGSKVSKDGDIFFGIPWYTKKS